MGFPEPTLHFTLKVAGRCNLNCAYCYVYNKGDETWRARPSSMSDEVLAAAAERIRRHAQRSGQRSVRIVFHGGEPCLVGAARFDRWCVALTRALARHRVHFFLQTNGTLLDDDWLPVLRRHGVTVGISIDGPQDIHDRARVDHAGNGSYAAVARGIARLRAAGHPVALLCVIPLGAEPLRVHRHLRSLEPNSIDYIFPDYTHDGIGIARAAHGPTPCADFLLPIFDDWLASGDQTLDVEPFRAISRMILGGESRVDHLGNRPYNFVFIETDGAIEGLDVLRVCGHGMAATGLNVLRDDFVDVLATPSLHRDAIFAGMPLARACEGCPERTTCGGGYLPHRYSARRGFDNPSVWCADLLRIFDHLRGRLGVAHDETLLRRQVLREMASEAGMAASP